MRTPKTRARGVRGVLVGACSAAMTVGAHTAAGGGVPAGGGLAFSLLVSATLGAVVATAALEGRHRRLVAVTGALAVSQLLGHLGLMMTAGHHHGDVVGASPWMVASHLAAAVLLGVAISSVEYLYVVCASVLSWLSLVFVHRGRPSARDWFANPVVMLSARPRSGLRMRAPPLVASIH